MWSFMASWFTSISLFLFLNFMIGIIILAHRFTTPKNQHGEENAPQLARAPSLLYRVRSFNFSLYRSESLKPETFHIPDEIPHQNSGPDSDHDNEHHVTRIMSEPKIEPEQSQQGKTKKSAREKNVLAHTEEDYIIERRQPATAREKKGGRLSEPMSFRDDEEVDAKADDHDHNEHHVTRIMSEPKIEPEQSQSHQGKMKKSASEKNVIGHTDENKIIERRRPATVREKKGGRLSEPMSFRDDEEVDAKADDFINRFKQQLKLQRLDSLLRYKEMLGRGSEKRD